IITTLAQRAYRRTAKADDIATLMEFYKAGRAEGNFDSGIEAALQRVLADPSFIYRGETESAALAPGKTYTLSDIELASRLSFFLWSRIPEEELLTLAEQGRRKNQDVLERQVQRRDKHPCS